MLPALSARRSESHKGTYGRVLVVAGSRSMPGAAHLATMGALRGGAGLTILATPASVLPLVAPATPCATYAPLPETRSGALGARAIDAVLARAESADTIVLGPGLGLAAGTVRAVRTMVAELCHPLVLDADGLNALAGKPEMLKRRSGTTVITPHPGELTRLDGMKRPKGPAERRKRAERLSSRSGAIVCLKGHHTVLTDGSSTRINETGNPGMATGGSGDVLSGILGALLCRFDSAFDAAVLAVHVHGLAGDLAARKIGQTSLIATDLLDHLGEAFRKTAR